jgi:membrane-bound ClpP family serine protease
MATKPPKPKKTALDKYLEKNDVLLMLYPKSRTRGFSQSITREDERTIYKLLRGRTAKGELLILLDTSGGNVYSAVKIMNMLREKYTKVRIGVAQEAKSSGTMMCLGADELIMSNISELGPLDKPMNHPSKETSVISALDIVKSLDTIIDTAIEKQKDFASDIVTEHPSVSKAKAIELAARSMSELISPLLCKEDLKEYNQALRLLRMAEIYGTRLLEEHGLAWLSDKELRKRTVRTVIRRLVWEFPEHGFAICRDEVDERLFLWTIKSEETKYWDELWNIYESHLEKKEKLIAFM